MIFSTKAAAIEEAARFNKITGHDTFIAKRTFGGFTVDIARPAQTDKTMTKLTSECPARQSAL